MKSGAEIGQDLTFRTTDDGYEYGCSVIAARRGSKTIGGLTTCYDKQLDFFSVRNIYVDADARRQNVATKLYERAAKLACDRGKALASQDLGRNAMSDAFWKKQIAKGRAEPTYNAHVQLLDTCRSASAGLGAAKNPAAMAKLKGLRGYTAISARTFDPNGAYKRVKKLNAILTERGHSDAERDAAYASLTNNEHMMIYGKWKKGATAADIEQADAELTDDEFFKRYTRRRGGLGAVSPMSAVAYGAFALILGGIGWVAWKVYKATAPVAGPELIPGGRAAGMRPEDFDPHQLALGIKVEMEHTGDWYLAREIACDHLAEYPDYYTRLLQAGL